MFQQTSQKVFSFAFSINNKIRVRTTLDNTEMRIKSELLVAIWDEMHAMATAAHMLLSRLGRTATEKSCEAANRFVPYVHGFAYVIVRCASWLCVSDAASPYSMSVTASPMLFHVLLWFQYLGKRLVALIRVFMRALPSAMGDTACHSFHNTWPTRAGDRTTDTRLRAGLAVNVHAKKLSLFFPRWEERPTNEEAARLGLKCVR